MSKITGISERMKENYEKRSRFHLSRRTPVIMRLDGRCFHRLTKKCNKPFDEWLCQALLSATLRLMNDISGAQCAYLQSDEISILITDYQSLDTEAWFDYNVQKMSSVGSGVMSAWFSYEFGPPSAFDCRVFNIPRDEVCNYFISRQMDWARNSLSMFASSFFSADELMHKGKADIHEMLHDKGKNWASIDDVWKNGTFICRADDGNWKVTHDTIFTRDRDAIDSCVYQEVAE